LVKTEACGVCHTNLHAARGDRPVKPTMPFIPEALAFAADGKVKADIELQPLTSGDVPSRVVLDFMNT